MAFVVTFINPRGEPVERGPYDFLRFDGNLLRDRHDGPIVATHREHRWSVTEAASSFSRLQCGGPLYVCFADQAQRESRSFGPFAGFSCVDGVAFVDSRIVAFCDQQQVDWYSYDLGAHWLTLIVSTEPRSTPTSPIGPAAFPGA